MGRTKAGAVKSNELGSHMKLSVLALITGLLTFSVLAEEWKMATYNIRNFKGSRGSNSQSTDLSRLKSIISKTEANFIGVQEIVDANGFKKFVKNYLPQYGLVIEECGGSGRQNLGFLYRKDEFSVKKVSIDLSITLAGNCLGGLRPALIGDFIWKHDNSRVRVIGLHLKAGGKQKDKTRRYRQFAILEKNIQQYYKDGHKNLVIMGDLNTTDYQLKNSYYRKFITFLENSKLQNFTIDPKCSSYYKKQGAKDRQASRLDHILVSDSMAADHPYIDSESQSHCMNNSCKESSLAELGESYSDVSDHCPVVSRLTL